MPESDPIIVNVADRRRFVIERQDDLTILRLEYQTKEDQQWVLMQEVPFDLYHLWNLLGGN